MLEVVEVEALIDKVGLTTADGREVEVTAELELVTEDFEDVLVQGLVRSQAFQAGP